MNKCTLSALLSTLCLSASVFASDKAPFGVVNFTSCILESKIGQKEQETMENIRKQMSAMIEDNEKELKELTAKFEDTEFLDSLSPKAEEEMKLKYQTLQEDLGRYQNQFYQVLQQAQHQLIQKMSGTIAIASEVVAKEKGLDFVMNKEACFYIRPDLEVTKEVISQMDKSFDSSKKSSENGLNPALDATAAETLLNKVN
jgi:outer membrane protein